MQNATNGRRRHRSPYARALLELAPDMDPDAIDANMRLEHDTLDHLSHEQFVEEVAIARACEQSQPGYLERVRRSFWG